MAKLRLLFSLFISSVLAKFLLLSIFSSDIFLFSNISNLSFYFKVDKGKVSRENYAFYK